mgnify:CR=1 FL=1
MDRREFLKTAGLGAAAAGLAACAPKALVEESGAKADKGLEGTMPQHYPGVGLLGYGCMRWPMVDGTDGKKHIAQEEVNRLVDFALEHGVNYFDTSPVYLEGDSERATAEALNRHPRESWLLATKLSNFSDASYDNSVKMYRKSLEIFKTDHVDYYLLHSLSGGEDFARRFGDTGIMDFLLKEKAAGHIRHLGFSFHGAKDGFDEMMALHDSGKYRWDFVQIQMNYVDWTHAGGRNTDAEYLYGELDRRRIPVVIMEPLRGGRLADMPAGTAVRYRPEVEESAEVVLEVLHIGHTGRRYLLAYNDAIPAVRQADHCIACGRCIGACPQHIAIPRELHRIDQYIESLKRETLG